MAAAGYTLAAVTVAWYVVELAVVVLGRVTGRTYRVLGIWHS